MGRFKALLLGVVTGLSGVFIACAYGFRYFWDGVVRHKDTQEPIPGIKVACLVDDREMTSELTTPEGTFSVGRDDGCDSFVFSDVDGEENGSYATLSTSLHEGGQNVVELTPQ